MREVQRSLTFFDFVMVFPITFFDFVMVFPVIRNESKFNVANISRNSDENSEPELDTCLQTLERKVFILELTFSLIL